MPTNVRGRRLPILIAGPLLVLAGVFLGCGDDEPWGALPDAPASGRPFDPGAPVGADELVRDGSASDAGGSADAAREPEDLVTLTITSPAHGETVTLPPSGKLPFVFTTSMHLHKAKTCAEAGVPRCGHAHVTIDGKACNAPRRLNDGGTAKQTYNTMPEAHGPSFVDFSFCPQPVDGPHVIEVELRQDNHAPMNPVIKRAVTVNVIAHEGGIPRDAGAD